MYKSQLNILFDLETLGTNFNAPIVQIGALKFDNEGLILSQFCINIDLSSLDEYNFESDFDTIKWWLSNPKKTIKSVFLNSKDNLEEALLKFYNWFKLDLELSNVNFWCNKDFDLPIINNAYKETKLNLSIPYINTFDLRNIKHYFDLNNFDIYSIKRTGKHHNALDDCLHNHKIVSKYIKEISNNN